MWSGPSSRNLRLVIDDRLRHAGQRAAALLDRFDQPLGRIDLALDVLARLGVRAFVAQQLAIVRADVQRRQLAVLEPNLVFAVVVALDEHVGRDAGRGRFGEVGARLGLELAQLVPDFLNLLDRHAGLLRDLRQAIVFQVFQVVRDERPQLVVERHARDELQHQAFFERARADARRIEPLHDAQRFFGDRHLLGAMRLHVAVELRRRAAAAVLRAASSGSRSCRGCR